MRCNVPAAVGFEHDGTQREQRGRGATCAHRLADETKSSEGQDSVATRGATCDAMFLPRSGSSTTERSASSGGGARRVRTEPAIALDDADEKREGPCHFQEQRPGTKRPRKGGNVDDVVDCPGEVPAWLMGLCRFLGDSPCWMPRGALIGGKGAGCDWAPSFSYRLNEM